MNDGESGMKPDENRATKSRRDEENESRDSAMQKEPERKEPRKDDEVRGAGDAGGASSKAADGVRTGIVTEQSEAADVKELLGKVRGGVGLVLMSIDRFIGIG